MLEIGSTPDDFTLLDLEDRYMRPVRDPLRWSKYINEVLQMWGKEAEIMFAAGGAFDTTFAKEVLEYLRNQDKLAVVDYSRNALASRLAIERCPTGAIVWLDDGNTAHKGKAAARIVRKAALPVGGHSTNV